MASSTLIPYVNLVIDHAATDNTLVAAQTGKRIIVHQLFLIVASAVNVRFESNTSGTALTGQMNFGANGGMALPFNEKGWFETNQGELLNMELSSTVSVDGALKYSVRA